MKVNLLLIISLLIFIFQPSVYAGNNIKKHRIPPRIEVFLKIHFAKYEIEKLKYDAEDKECKVKYTNGYKIEFDKNGNWVEIGSDYQPLPKSVIELLPRNALLYISRNYRRKIILKIKRKSFGYKVKLLDASDLLFDKNGHFLKKD